MKNKSLWMSLACFFMTCSAINCGSGAQHGSGQASTSMATDANGAVSATANANAPALSGIFLQDANIIYVSSGTLSCDSNVVAPGQSTARLWMSNVVPGGNYNVIVGDAYTSPDKGMGMEFALGGTVVDANCQNVTDQYPDTVGLGTLPHFDALQIRTIDANTLTGQLLDGTPQKIQAQVSVTVCPHGITDPFAPNYNDHCAIPRDCQPVSVTCQR